MSLVTVIQTVEIERHNNKALKEAMTARLRRKCCTRLLASEQAAAPAIRA